VEGLLFVLGLLGTNYFITKSSLSQKLSESSTLNTSGGANILRDGILRAYKNLNCSTEIFWNKSARSRINLNVREHERINLLSTERCLWDTDTFTHEQLQCKASKRERERERE